MVAVAVLMPVKKLGAGRLRAATTMSMCVKRQQTHRTAAALVPALPPELS